MTDTFPFGLAAVATALVAIAAALPARAAAALPDLVAVSAYDVRIGAVDGGELDPGAPRALRFSSAVENHGAATLELTAVPTEPERAAARQCIEWESGICTATRDVGTYEWHGFHLHWHATNFFEYELRFASGALAVSHRPSFLCIRDSQPAGPPPNPFTNLTPYTQCLDSRAGISPGWRFRVISTVPEQQFPLDGIPDGRYVLTIVADPDDVLAETDETNNAAHITIDLSGGGTRVAVLDGET